MVDNDTPELAWTAMQTQLFRHQPMEDMMAGKAGAMPIEDFLKITNEKLGVLKERYLEFLSKEPIEDLTDDAMRRWSKYTDGLPLKDYENALDLVPTLVNLVSLADAIPVDGTSLPFDLRYIASKVKSAIYFAPRRFTAAQFAFDEPRCRVLLFHTGRMVGTGCNSPFAAKMAVARTLHTIASSCGVKIGVRKFNVINQVGAAALDATIDCDAFANTHNASSHYDKDSFVGLAWRPVGESICAETYSTGKTNLPGSKRERDLLKSWARMVGEMYRFSNKPEKAAKVHPRLANFHKPAKGAKPAPKVINEKRKRKAVDVWAGDSDEDCHGGEDERPSLLLDIHDADASLVGDLF